MGLAPRGEERAKGRGRSPERRERAAARAQAPEGAAGGPPISSQNLSNRYAASCGPAAASGWYCTEKLFRLPSASRSSSPSTTSSLRQTWLTVTTPYGVSVGASIGASTAKPWLCAVTSTLLVVRS